MNYKELKFTLDETRQKIERGDMIETDLFHFISAAFYRNFNCLELDK